MKSLWMRGLLSAWLVLGSLGLYAQERVLEVVGPWEVGSLNPVDSGYIFTRMQVAETLVGVEPNGKLVGLVAQSWSVSPDGKAWRFVLRPGLKFHDGTVGTAEMVAASLRRSFSGESLSAVPLESVTADGNDVIIRTKTPFSVLPAFLGDYSSIILAPSSYQDGKVVNLVATGPYKLTSRDGGVRFEVEAFDGYPGNPPAVRKVRYSAVTNGDTRANLAVAGEADLVFTLAATAAARVKAGGKSTVSIDPLPRLRVVFFNLGLPQFADKRVREALSLSVDRAGIAAGILRNPASAATTFLPAQLKEWQNPAAPALKTDVARAKALLDEAGWKPGPDGIRMKDGQRLAASMIVLSNRPELAPIAAALQAQWRQVGFESSIQAGPSSLIPAAIQNGTMEMTFFARSYVNVPDPIATIVPDFTRASSVWGTVNWSRRDEMKALTDAYFVTFDEAQKQALREKIIALIASDVPVIPVSYYENVVAASNRITGVVVDPFEARYFLDRIRWK